MPDKNKLSKIKSITIGDAYVCVSKRLLIDSISRVLLHVTPPLRLDARITSFRCNATILYKTRIQACVHFCVLQKATVTKLPHLILGIVADAHNDRRTFSKFDSRQAQIVVLDLSLFGDAPFLIAASVMALVQTLKQKYIFMPRLIQKAERVIASIVTYQLFRPPDGQAYRCSSFPGAECQPNAIRAPPVQGIRFPGTT